MGFVYPLLMSLIWRYLKNHSKHNDFLVELLPGRTHIFACLMFMNKHHFSSTKDNSVDLMFHVVADEGKE